MTYDEGYWNYIGNSWLRHGLAPYSELVDNKPPGIFLVYGVSNLLFGMNFWFPRLMGILALTASAYFLFRITESWYDARAGVLAMGMFGLASAWKVTGGVYTAQTESFVLLFAMLAFYLLDCGAKVDRRHILWLLASGLCVGIATVFKQVAVLEFAALLYLGRRLLAYSQEGISGTLRPLAWVIAGFLAVHISTLLLLIASGTAPEDYFYCVFNLLFAPGSPTAPDLATRVDGFLRIFKRSEIVVFYPLLVLFFLQRDSFYLRSIPVRALGFWLGMEFLIVNASGNYAAYQVKSLIPSMSVLAALGILAFLDRNSTVNESRSRRFIQLLCAFLLIWMPIYLEPVAAFRNYLRKQSPAITSPEDCRPPYPVPGRAERKALGLWLKRHSNPEDYVFVAGYGATIQAYSERLSPSRYFAGSLPGAAPALRADLALRRPRWIVLPKFPEYEDWVHPALRAVIERYVTENHLFRECMWGYQLYEIKME